MNSINDFVKSQNVKILSLDIDSQGRWVIDFVAEHSGCGYLLLVDRMTAHIILPE